MSDIRYQVKRHAVEAIQYTGKPFSAKQILDWLGGKGQEASGVDVESCQLQPMFLPWADGSVMRVDPGKWVVRSDFAMTILSPEDFQAKYEPEQALAPPTAAPEGMVLVPRKANGNMIHAAVRVWDSSSAPDPEQLQVASETWNAMLSAAPAPQKGVSDG